MGSSTITSLKTTEALIAARHAAEESLGLLEDEAGRLMRDFGEAAGGKATLRFWEVVRDHAKSRLPAEPDRKPRGNLAKNQRSHGGREVTTTHGGVVLSETEKAWLVMIGEREHWLPKQHTAFVGKKHVAGRVRFDCLRLPEWLAANEQIDWEDE